MNPRRTIVIGTAVVAAWYLGWCVFELVALQAIDRPRRTARR